MTNDVAAGLPEPEFTLTDGFVTTIRRSTAVPRGDKKAHDEAHDGTRLALSRHQVEILLKCLMNSAIGDLMEIAGRSDRTKFRHQVLKPLLQNGLLVMTIPDKPTSSKQRYLITEKGRDYLDSMEKERGK